MGEFAALKGLEGRLYRGLSVPAAIDLATKVGVGPFRELAAKANRDGIELDPAICAMLERALTDMLTRRREILGFIPVDYSPQQRLASVLEVVNSVGVSALDMADHVMHDFDALLSPNIGRSTDSVTHSPKVAILYAYGIQTDAYFDKRESIAFYSGAHNGHANGKKPTVALLAEGTKASEVGGPAFDRLQVWYSDEKRLGKHASIEEVRHRVERDGERLLRGVARVDDLVLLDEFDPGAAIRSLDAAAHKLVEAKLASL